jgi:hypothetical protein
MDDPVSFGSREYFLMLALLVFARGMDFLSTWIATPNLVLEGNPLAKKLGWRWGIAVNLAVCLGLAFWPLPAIVICTTSVLVAARNFQSAWLMRSLGEERYRDWHVGRFRLCAVRTGRGATSPTEEKAPPRGSGMAGDRRTSREFCRLALRGRAP